MPHPPPAGRRVPRASPAPGAGSSAPPGRSPPRRCSRSPAPSPSGVTRHEYRQKEGTGSYGNWEDIPNSAEDGANEDGYTVPNLTNETVYTFELRSVVGTTEGAASESDPATPTTGICDRTQEVQDGILAAVSGVDECAAVTVANLAGIDRLDLDNKGITSLKAGDFAGLTGMTTLILNENDLTSLPAGVFSGLTALRSLFLIDNDLSSLPGAVFSGLTALTDQVLDAVEARLAAPRAAGTRVRLAGQALPFWDGGGKTAADPGSGARPGGDAGAGAGDNASERALAARDRDAMTAIRDWMARGGTNPGSGAGTNGSGVDAWRGEGPDGRVRSRALTGRDFVTGTSFELTDGSAEAGGHAALWGRGAISRFDGREGALTLDGEVTTGLMGADWASAPGSGAGRWTAGLAVGHARGTGSYREGGGCTGRDGDGSDVGASDDGDGDGNDPGASGCAGEVESTLTGLWPYGGLQLTDRLSISAALG